MALKKFLETRWFLHQFTNDKVFNEFDKWWKSFYFWVDCSSNSMTIGNFVALLMAIHFMLAWNKCYLLVWWATSTIWNPSGKDNERPILTEENLKNNQDWITKQFDLLIKNVGNITWKKLDYEIVNNYDFFKNMNILDFLKEVGRFMTVNWMINKDIVKKRITDPDKWISYAEFSYMLIMWYDFYHLYKEKDVILEVWWSDEWDWILSWIELVSKKLGKEVYGVTNKLILDANGKKFGKSEWNAIWLDKEKTSPYKMYQYFINTLDLDIERYLKLFTFLDDNEIKKIVSSHLENPEKREWQKLLAYKVVEIIHWAKDAKIAEKISELLFSDQDKIEIIKNSDKDELGSIFAELGWYTYNSENLFEMIVKSGLATSNSDARKTIESWAFYINEQKITDIKYDFSNDFINSVLLVKKWKKNFKLIINK